MKIEEILAVGFDDNACAIVSLSRCVCFVCLANEIWQVFVINRS